MQRISSLCLLTILFLLFSLSPVSLAKASNGEAFDRSVPNDGSWAGTTSRGQPMSFAVFGGMQWFNFKLKTDFQIDSCRGTVGITIPGLHSSSGTCASLPLNAPTVPHLRHAVPAVRAIRVVIHLPAAPRPVITHQ
jgi:hypothetical protein